MDEDGMMMLQIEDAQGNIRPRLVVNPDADRIMLVRFRYAGKQIIQIIRWRRTWSECGAWLNANRDKKSTEQYRRRARVFSILGRRLKVLNSTVIFEHLVRRSGTLIHR